jgi:hypothetical protein
MGKYRKDDSNGINSAAAMNLANENEQLREKLEATAAELDEESRLVISLSAENVRLQKQLQQVPQHIDMEADHKILKSIRSDENMEVYEEQIRLRDSRGEELKELRASITKSIDSETAIRLINLIDDYAIDLENH